MLKNTTADTSNTQNNVNNFIKFLDLVTIYSEVSMLRKLDFSKQT